MIRGLAHVCIAATDLASTERFYCSGLGFTKVFDFIRESKTVGFYLKVSERTYIEAFHQDALHEDAQCPIQHLCFEVTDVDEVSRRLKSQGYAVTDKALGTDQSWQIWTTDPSGVRIEFHQYTEKSSQITGRNCTLD
jgi:catechol 2,3-dioxygenase-like lactoylglutathione lyase family enzyme